MYAPLTTYDFRCVGQTSGQHQHLSPIDFYIENITKQLCSYNYGGAKGLFKYARRN